MTHILPPLPYAKDALEPYISKMTLDFHYGKHHQAYVNNLVKLLPGSGFEHVTLEEIILHGEGALFNNAAQVWNHTFYWNCLSPSGGGDPAGLMETAILRDFDSVASFREKFTAAAAGLFGSGWVWLACDNEGRLEIIQESNAGNPLKRGYTPLLTCDVWEHAYYIDKQNRRPDYIMDFWKIVDWDAVAERYIG